MNPYHEKVEMPDEHFRIKSFHTSAFEHDIAVHPHWHEEVEILYVMSGHAMQQVNNNFFQIVPGDLIIIGSGQLHSTYSYERSNCEILVFMFTASRFLEPVRLQSSSPEIGSFSGSILFKNPLKTTDANVKVLLDCLIEIHTELEHKGKAYAYMIKSLLYRMAGILDRNDCYEISQLDNNKMQLIKKMLEKSFDLIDRNYSEEIDLSKAATASNLSIPHFCRLFKKATGMTFNDYLAFYRVNRAEKLLQSHMKLTDIAMECGFGSVSSFIRNFKKYKNCTPSAFKNL